MLKFTANGNRIAFKRLSLVAFAAALCVGILTWAMNTLASTQAPVKDGIPNLASSSFAWLAAGAEWLDPPSGLRGPIRNDPDHPYQGAHLPFEYMSRSAVQSAAPPVHCGE